MNNPERFKDDAIHGSPRVPLNMYNQYYLCGGLMVPFHWHDEVELIYMEYGCMDILIGSKKLRAHSGDFFCINSHETHQISSIGQTPSIHHALVFSLQILTCELFDDSQSDYIHPLLNQNLLLPTKINTNILIGKNILNCYLEIKNLIETKDAGWYLELKGNLFKIMGNIAKLPFIQVTNEVKDYDYKMSHLKQVFAYIHENYSEKIYIDKLAGILNINTQYFCRYFKQLMGMTPLEYINNYRLTQACKIIQQENISVLELCLRVGFENPSYFIRLFKKQMNMTPLQYKKLFNQSPPYKL